MQNDMAHLNDETSKCKVHHKCTLLQAVLLDNQDRFTELAQEIKQSIQIVGDSKENDITTKTDLYTIVNKGSNVELIIPCIICITYI